MSDLALRPAATVLVLRDGQRGLEVFMVRRHEGIPFMGGAHVFPGGAVDSADHEALGARWCDGRDHAERQLEALSASDAIALHVAAIRELFEEAGVLLARDRSGRIVSLADPAIHERFTAYRADVHAGRLTIGDLAQREEIRLAADALVLFAHWVTPPTDSRRYDTRFFMARAPAAQAPAHDDHESTDGVWISAADALAAAARRDLILPPPTWYTLRELERFESADSALAWAKERTVHRREPTLLSGDNRRVLVMPGDPSLPESEGQRVLFETRFVWTTDRWLPL